MAMVLKPETALRAAGPRVTDVDCAKRGTSRHDPSGDDSYAVDEVEVVFGGKCPAETESF
jgi:hypothetical protein